MCGGVTVYTALKRAGLRFNDWVLIVGSGGGLGHLGIQYAKALGARVLGLDVSSKADFCHSLGIDAFLDFTSYSPIDLTFKIKEITGGGAKIILQCSSSVKAYAQAVDWLGFRGTLVCLGVPEGEEEPIGGAKVGPMINLELTIFGMPSPVSLLIMIRGRANGVNSHQIREPPRCKGVFGDCG
jgi:propanol-preferring alcohol dehydrogenase